MLYTWRLCVFWGCCDVTAMHKWSRLSVICITVSYPMRPPTGYFSSFFQYSKLIVCVVEGRHHCRWTQMLLCTFSTHCYGGCTKAETEKACSLAAALCSFHVLGDHLCHLCPVLALMPTTYVILLISYGLFTECPSMVQILSHTLLVLCQTLVNLVWFSVTTTITQHDRS